MANKKRTLTSKLKNLKKGTKILIVVSFIGIIALSIIIPIVVLNRNVIKQDQIVLDEKILEKEKLPDGIVEEEILPDTKEGKVYWEYNQKRYDTYEQAYNALVKDYQGDGTGNTYTQDQIDARDANGPFPTTQDANKAITGENKVAISAIGDGSSNIYTQAQIDHAKGGNFVAPLGAIIGENIQAIGDGSGKTYTQDQIDARDVTGPFPSQKDAISGIAILGNNKDFSDIEGSGDFSGHTYSQDQIDHAKGKNFVAPIGAIIGENIQATGDGSGITYSQTQIVARDAIGPFPMSVEDANKAVAGEENKKEVVATGDGSGNIYSPSHINARDALGPFPSQQDALSGLAKVGENISQVFSTGDGSGNTYTQDQIDHAKGGNFIAPVNAIVGLNTPGKFDMQLDSALSKENYQLMKLLINPLLALGLLTKPDFVPEKNPNEKIKWGNFINTFTHKQIQEKGFINSDALRFEKLIKDAAWSNPIFISNFSQNPNVNIDNKEIKWYAQEISQKIGDGSGNTYTREQIAARDAIGPFPMSVEDANKAITGENKVAVSATGDGSGNTYTQAQIDHAKGGNFIAPLGAIEGKNIAPVKAIGDGSGNTYTQAQIDHAKGGNFVAPFGAIIGENIQATGDGSGKTYRQEQIAARDAIGPFPMSVEDANKALVGINRKKLYKGDGSGNIYTQAQIDHAKGGEFVAPDGAILGINSKEERIVDPMGNIKDSDYNKIDNSDIKALFEYINFLGWTKPKGKNPWEISEYTLVSNSNFVIRSNDNKKWINFKNDAAGSSKKISDWNIDDLYEKLTYSFENDGERTIAKFKEQFPQFAHNISDDGKFKWSPNKEIQATGDGSGNTYTQAQIDARDIIIGPFPKQEDVNKAIVGLNDAPNIKGDGTGNTYTQAQIDHAKGGNFVAPLGAIIGENIQVTGDGSGKTYTQDQIDARDTNGPFPTAKDANKAIIGENKAAVSSTGDGTGNTYTQAQIDHAKGGNFVAPPNAIEGLNQEYDLDKITEITN